ncbi:MAG: ESX secretion-associated protein EspG [Mycobacteriaceae bacterium]|nr:ESX secretion-associated protein EspG [Mycobacteriaceae bacterium]
MSLQALGSIHVADLVAIRVSRGNDGLPYPFTQARPNSAGLPDAAALTSVCARLRDGDLRNIRRWVETYDRADIWVECRVLHSSHDVPDARIMAFRAGQSGYLAVQRPDDDVVDVSELSPYSLGPAIAHLVGLTGPGSHARIVVPKYVDYFAAAAAAAAAAEDEDDDDDYHESVLQPVRSVVGRAVKVSNADVRAVATIQSRCQHARSWGVDWGRRFLFLVQIRDDGDYLYDRDFSLASPIAETRLSERIDGLIAEDVAVLRNRRGLQ